MATRLKDAECVGKDAPQAGQPRDKVGVGFGGVWTCTDDFVHEKRSNSWASQARGKTLPPMPPRIYVDYTTIITEVPNVCEFRRGDHGLIAINVVRCLSPTLDKLISFLGSIELCYIYHHFTMMDDVSYVDECGVPRAYSGEPAQILEYSNTIPEMWEELRLGVSGRWSRFLRVLFRCMLDKAHCHRLALADYGDSPNLYVVKEHLDEAARERVYKNALHLEENHRPYHFMRNNCEHTANLIHRGKFTSPNAHFVLGAAFRWLVTSLSLFLLNALALSCDSGACAPSLIWMVAYIFFAVLPVALQAIIRLAMVVRSLNRHHAEALIDYNDYWHLVAKELGRAICVGGGAAFLISTMPRVVLYTQFRYFAAACAICLLAYFALDVVYNCLAHAAMRLVFLPIFGKVWLIERAEPNAKKKVA